MAIHHGGSTGVVLRFALTGIVVSCQRGRRARQHQKQTSQQDESVDG
jgi:protein subunit release factor B